MSMVQLRSSAEGPLVLQSTHRDTAIPVDEPQRQRRVLLIINSMGGGGAERVVATVANYLHRTLRWSVTILTLERGPVRYKLAPGVEVRSLHGTYLTTGFWNVVGVPILAVELAWFLRRHQTDSVMSFLVRSNLILVLTRWLGNRRPIIISERCATDTLYPGDTLKSRMMRVLIGLFYPFAEKIVAISNGVKAALMRLGVDGSRVQVIYNPQNLDEITSAVSPVPPQASAGQPFKIAAVGRLTEQKDYPTLLRAIRQLCDDGVNARLIVFGEGPDAKALKALAARLNLQERIEWRGWIASPHASMSECDAFVLTSRWEGFGNAIVEAMACGLPVICTDCQSGPREILADGEYGQLVPVGDSAAVATAIRRLVDNPHLRASFRARGLERAREFDMLRVAGQYAEVLTERSTTPSL
jgi:glycosyltransferase involved in cell wall biosynthesis